MKKTLIALAAVAAVGAASAQNVSLTGSISAATQRNLAGTSNGIAMTDNTLVVSVSDEWDNGIKMTAMMVIENDTNRGAAFTRADQAFGLTTSLGGLKIANTRSGGNQGAALVAPANLADDQWSSAVITREAIDVVALSIPLSAAFTGTYSYIEGKNLAMVAASGAIQPSAVSQSLNLKYSADGLTVSGSFVSTAFADPLLSALNAASSGRSTSTDLSIVYGATWGKIGFGYDSPRRGKPESDKAATLVGLAIPVSNFTLGFNYGKRDTASFSQYAAEMALSKRTNVNFSYGQDQQSGAVATMDQYRLSLNHSF